MDGRAGSNLFGNSALSGGGALTIPVRALVVSLALAISGALYGGWITNYQALAAYTLLLLGYLYLELKGLWARDRQHFWLNPVVVASFFTFITAFGVTNSLYFMPEALVARVGLVPVATKWMNQLMLLVLFAAVSMWSGYGSSLGRATGQILRDSRVLRKWMIRSFRVRKSAFYAFVGADLVSKLAAIALGVYGYSSSYDQMAAAATYTQYLTLAGGLGELALVGIALQCFSTPRPRRWDRLLLMFILGYEVIFGFISGMKGNVVFPLISVALVYYSQRGRFPRWLVPAVLAGLVAAYAVIEPFREARQNDAAFKGTDISSIVSTLVNAKDENPGEHAPVAISVMARLNMAYMGSLGIEYASRVSELPDGSPDFLGSILLAPAYAFVPRLVWPSKPLETTGVWYARQIVGMDSYDTSIAMSPFTYLNFAGGPVAVILGFLVLGIVQRGVYDGFRSFGGGGLIVLLGLLSSLANIPSAFGAFVAGFLRLVPLLLVAQRILLRRKP